MQGGKTTADQCLARVPVRYDPQSVRARPKLTPTHGIPLRPSPLPLQQRDASSRAPFEADPLPSRIPAGGNVSGSRTRSTGSDARRVAARPSSDSSKAVDDRWNGLMTAAQRGN